MLGGAEGTNDPAGFPHLGGRTIPEEAAIDLTLKYNWWGTRGRTLPAEKTRKERDNELRGRPVRWPAT